MGPTDLNTTQGLNPALPCFSPRLILPQSRINYSLNLTQSLEPSLTRFSRVLVIFSFWFSPGVVLNVRALTKK